MTTTTNPISSAALILGIRLAFRWTAQDGGTVLRAVERMNKASNWPATLRRRSL